ncbi:MAG TPA: type II toxin-antitoxin system VapC family toxin [Candidatus Dormibacteraeota bacterium]|nr:type II toxin-antitoxin system VapC family toxin [Candidatus Dormibacteraeota bacterium]
MTTPSASKRFVVDSSGWIEYFGNGPKADSFAHYLERPEVLLISSITIYEVYKKLLSEQRNYLAEQFLSQAFAFYDREIYLSAGLAAQAAKISLQHQLAMADAIIYATAQEHRAQLVTSDAHFANLAGVILL